MGDSNYNDQIDQIASQMQKDKISPDEQDPQKLQPYHELAKKQFSLDDKAAIQIIYEALLYLKLKSGDSFDPIQEGDKFGGGFS